MIVLRSILLGKLLLMLSLSLAGCSKEKEPTYLKEELVGLAPISGPDKIDIILARNINDTIPCADYGEGCLSAHRFRTRNLNFLAIEFETPGQAELAAKKIYGWTARNWLLDDVDGEPQLERWAEQYLSAKSFNPVKRKAQESAEKSVESGVTSPATAP